MPRHDHDAAAIPDMLAAKALLREQGLWTGARTRPASPGSRRPARNRIPNFVGATPEPAARLLARDRRVAGGGDGEVESRFAACRCARGR